MDQRSEKDKMLAGELYRAIGPELVADRAHASRLLDIINMAPYNVAALRDSAMDELFGEFGDGAAIRPPFHCDYGYNIRIGARVFINLGCTFLDVAPIDIGEGSHIGPNVQIYTADHPRDPALRRDGLEFGRPVRVGANVWIGGGAILLPGVTIGDDAIIGAGSVVTHDVPPTATVAGNPARPIR